MYLRKRAFAVSVFALLCTVPLAAQERGSWRAVSKTAQSITGDITFNGDRMIINFFTLTIAEIRSLKPEELAAAFPAEDAERPLGTGHLFRLSIAADRRFLHKNTLCGSDETQWMATYVSGRSGKELQIAFFSNAAPPVLTFEALRDSPNLCGTFSYGR